MRWMRQVRHRTESLYAYLNQPEQSGVGKDLRCLENVPVESMTICLFMLEEFNLFFSFSPSLRSPCVIICVKVQLDVLNPIYGF